MENTIQRAYAKLNLSLNIFPDLTEGYYRVLFINVQTALHDEVEIKKTTGGIEINDTAVDGAQNLALSAARLTAKQYSLHSGLRIDIRKHIPVSYA